MRPAEDRLDSTAPSGDRSAFEVVSRFVEALAARDGETMRSLHAEDYVVDWVYGDAFETPPVTAEESAAFFRAWFVGFDEIDYEVKRTIAAEEVVVTEWVFTGTHTGPLARCALPAGSGALPNWARPWGAPLICLDGDR